MDRDLGIVKQSHSSISSRIHKDMLGYGKLDDNPEIVINIIIVAISIAFLSVKL